jgi:hypothetical protein
MSTGFKEFLHEQALKHQAEAEAAKAAVAEWRAAINALFHQLRQWLKESDPDGLIEIEDSEQEIKEPGLGRYKVPRLNLQVFGKWIGIIPKAYRSVGIAKPPRKNAPEHAKGRIDITDELRRYVLYRFQENGSDVWYIDGLDHGHDISEKRWPGQVEHVPRFDPVPLTAEAFEKALMSYLR